jgi:hypothetical protein
MESQSRGGLRIPAVYLSLCNAYAPSSFEVMDDAFQCD